MRMPFGKHRGVPIDQVPESYLVWCLDTIEDLSPTLRREIEVVLGIQERPQPRAALVVSTVNTWYRRMAQQFHPDLGGSHEGMKAVNAGRELLLELAGGSS